MKRPTLRAVQIEAAREELADGVDAVIAAAICVHDAARLLWSAWKSGDAEMPPMAPMRPFPTSARLALRLADLYAKSDLCKGEVPVLTWCEHHEAGGVHCGPSCPYRKEVMR